MLKVVPVLERMAYSKDWFFGRLERYSNLFHHDEFQPR